jgi:superfamily II DNA or RNA helicase
MYHEKMGLIYDAEFNIVAFSGSTNESETAFSHNYEVVDVFCSWQSESDKKRVGNKELAFHKLWTRADESIIILDFPKAAKEKLLLFKKDAVDFDIDKKDNTADFWESLIGDSSVKPKDAFRLPDNIQLHNYQCDAIKNWTENGYRGIFDMATGSGKTYTGLGALADLSKQLRDKLGVFIVCPYQHLVEQWVEDIRAFNVEPLICYSKYDWERKLKNLINDFKLGVIERYCVIACNASFALPKMQEQIAKIKGNTCLIIDEAHNFGASGLQKCLSPNFKFRLALSATIARHHDEEGTQILFDYFGPKCIEFSLKDAIDNDFLTRYKYYPVVVTLNSSELNEYISLTDRIINIIRRKGKDEKLPKQAEMLLIKRARIVAGAQSKVDALRQKIMPYKDKNNILVYCGATRVTSDGEDGDGEDERQIEAVTKMLGFELGMKVSMFTSKEKADERARLKESFAEGEMQALVAIKCLDEGVNIPGIRTAFILASSTNPKEYIQRRGRVLRKAKGKDFAEIYDFIVMPHDIYSGRSEIVDVNAELSLVKRELERIEDFRALCENPIDSFALRDKIDEYYKTNYIGGEDYGI